MRTVSRLGDYLAVGIVGLFTVILALSYGADPRPAELIESPEFAISVKGVTAIGEDDGEKKSFKVGTQCTVLGYEGPGGAVVEIGDKRWRVHRSCVKVLSRDN